MYGATELGVALASGNLLTGWANYFILGQVSPTYAAIDRHATLRLRQWPGRKHKVRSGAASATGSKSSSTRSRRGRPGRPPQPRPEPRRRRNTRDKGTGDVAPSVRLGRVCKGPAAEALAIARRWMLYHHLANWPDDRIRPLMETFGRMLVEQRVFREVFGVI